MKKPFLLSVFFLSLISTPYLNETMKVKRLSIMRMKNNTYLVFNFIKLYDDIRPYKFVSGVV